MFFSAPLFLEKIETSSIKVITQVKLFQFVKGSTCTTSKEKTDNNLPFGVTQKNDLKKLNYPVKHVKLVSYSRTIYNNKKCDK